MSALRADFEDGAAKAGAAGNRLADASAAVRNRASRRVIGPLIPATVSRLSGQLIQLIPHPARGRLHRSTGAEMPRRRCGHSQKDEDWPQFRPGPCERPHSHRGVLQARTARHKHFSESRYDHRPPQSFGCTARSGLRDSTRSRFFRRDTFDWQFIGCTAVRGLGSHGWNRFGNAGGEAERARPISGNHRQLAALSLGGHPLRHARLLSPQGTQFRRPFCLTDFLGRCGAAGLKRRHV